MCGWACMALLPARVPAPATAPVPVPVPAPRASLPLPPLPFLPLPRQPRSHPVRLPGGTPVKYGERVGAGEFHRGRAGPWPINAGWVKGGAQPGPNIDVMEGFDQGTAPTGRQTGTGRGLTGARGGREEGLKARRGGRG